MQDADCFRLHFGPYRTPRFKYGQIVEDAARGDVVIVGLGDGPIPWPVSRRIDVRRGTPGLVLYQGLAKAVQRESAHWWNVGRERVRRWRRALGVQPTTAGTSRLRAAYAKEETIARARSKAHAKSRDPAQDALRRAKIAAAKTGKSRPPHVQE